jgi:peptidoglycan/LPS O-acetylase OafA/YrhL
MKTNRTNIMIQNKNIIRIALVTAFILLIPFLAMRFTSEVNWDETDFILAGALIFGTGLMYDLVTRKIGKYRVAIGIALLAALLLIWAELAVGIFGTPFSGQ